MPATTKETTCLLCSLCCPAGVAFGDYGLATPAYPGYAAQQQGLCFRGHYISELISHPSRLDLATVREPDRVRTLAPAEALRRVAALLPTLRDEVAVVIDGNLPCEELDACVHATRGDLGLNRVTVFIPLADEALLRGLAAAPARRIGRDALADCDVILAVGDPFATHPLVAGPVLEAVAKARGHCLLNIDSLRGRTARFATDFCQVRPGGEPAALAGLLRLMGFAEAVPQLSELDASRAARMAGVPPAALERLAHALLRAERLGVVLSLPEGRCGAASAAAALAAKVADARAGGVCPLLTYGNAVGAWRTASALKTQPLASLLADIREGKVKKLIVLGTDLVAALPAAELASAEITLAASPMPSATTARARFVVPMALWFEIGGTALDGAVEQRRVQAAAAPPGGALSAAAILRALGPRQEEPRLEGEESAKLQAELSAILGAAPEVALADALGKPADWAPPAAQGRLLLVSRADSKGFADGSMTTQLAWPALTEPRAVLLLSPQDAQGLPSAEATVRTDGLAVTLPVEASADVPPGVAAVSPRFPETRALFAWGERGVGPGLVSLEKSGGND